MNAISPVLLALSDAFVRHGLPLRLSVSAVPELGLLLQLLALGTGVGSAVALRAKRRHRDADTWAITTAWATLGLIVGLAIVCLEWLL
jgi:Na+/glutamate symporter